MFREITTRNWTERDPTNEHFAMPGKLGMRPMTGNDWAGLFLGFELAARVPESLQSLFLVARNTLPYGHSSIRCTHSDQSSCTGSPTPQRFIAIGISVDRRRSVAVIRRSRLESDGYTNTE